MVLAYLCLFIVGLFDNGRAPYLPDLIEEMGLTDLQSGLYFAIPSLISFIGSCIASRLISLLGTLHVLRTALLITNLGYLVMALGQSWPVILCGTIFFGLGLGLVGVSQHIIIKESSDRRVRRQLFSGLHSMFAFSSLLAPLLAYGTLTMGVSWRIGFLIMTAIGTVIFLGSLSLSPQPPREEEPVKKRESSQKPSRSHFLYLSIVLASYVQAEFSISSRLVLYVRRELGVAADKAPFYLTLFFLTLLVGRVLFTLFHFRALSNRQILVGSLLGSLVTVLLGLNWNPWMFSVSGFFMAPFFAYCMDYITEVFQEHADIGISYAMAAMSLVLVAMHYLVGLLSEIIGLKMALYIGPIGLLVSLILLMLHPILFKESRS
ncbi:MFS transporter [Bdellovibrionales bacterium]|nr:MFS transporter [Bdellovibrionales bacterium]